MRMVTVTLPKHLDDALQRFLDHEVVRVEDAPPGRYDEEHLQEVKRLRHGYEGGVRVPVVVINVPRDGIARVVHPDNVREITVDWAEIEKASSVMLVEKLVEEIRNLPGLDENEKLQKILTDLMEHRMAIKQQGQ